MRVPNLRRVVGFWALVVFLTSAPIDRLLLQTGSSVPDPFTFVLIGAGLTTLGYRRSHKH